MSNKIFKSIIIEIAYNETKLSSDYVILLRMYPLLRELILNKVEIFKKLIELVGDKEDKYYEEFYNNNFKDFKLKTMYSYTFINEGLNKFESFHNSFSDNYDFIRKFNPPKIETKIYNSFSDINDFIKKIKDYILVDGKDLMNEIKMALDNIKKLPEIKQKEIKQKEIKPKTKKKSISSTIKKLVWNTNIGEDIGKAKCLCCKSTDITQLSFNCGHIIAEANGGDTIVSNLKPICQNCNSSMGTKNMNDFMETLK
jgi:hypothetical protein